MRTINLKKLHKFNEERLGFSATDGDYDEIIREDCDVILPDGRKVIFRKNAIHTFDEITRRKEAFQFFSKVGRSQMNDSRGKYAGTILTDKADVRWSRNQLKLMKDYLRPKSKNFGTITTKAQIQDFIKNHPDDEIPSKFLYMRTKVMKIWPHWGDENGRNWWDGFISEWSALPQKEQGKLAQKVWNQLKENVSRGNRVASIVLGSFDRTSRIPYARPTVLTIKHREKVDSYNDFYAEIDRVFKETYPDKHALQHSMTDHIDPVFSLNGTAFTTITVNVTVQSFYHRDGKNFDGGVGILTALTQGDYEGQELCFPELRLAFDIRDGDFICGDTTNLVHANLGFRSKSDNAERVSFVFYAREGFKYADSYVCEQVRKQFLEYLKEENKRLLKDKGHLHPWAKNKNWGGIHPGQWISQEWQQFKNLKGHPECSDTNYSGTAS